MQANQLGREHLGEDLGDLGLARAGRSFDQERLVEREREEDRGLDALVGDVAGGAQALAHEFGRDVHRGEHCGGGPRSQSAGEAGKVACVSAGDRRTDDVARMVHRIDHAAAPHRICAMRIKGRIAAGQLAPRHPPRHTTIRGRTSSSSRADARGNWRSRARSDRDCAPASSRGLHRTRLVMKTRRSPARRIIAAADARTIAAERNSGAIAAEASRRDADEDHVGGHGAGARHHSRAARTSAGHRRIRGSRRATRPG